MPSGVRLDPLEPRRLLATTPVVIDLLGVYTTNAKNIRGGAAAISTLIQQSVDTMNKALIDSQISVTIRLIATEEVSYAGSNNLQTDRQRLEINGDGYLDNVHARRDFWGADLVTLITDGPNIGGGNASLMEELNPINYSNDTRAFSAIAENSIGPGLLALAHELGHNLGGGHERDNQVPFQNVRGPFLYSYGYRYQSNGRWHNDIMSYSYESQEIPLALYANPSVSFDGAPTGKPANDPLQADLAATFAQTATIVAAYRPTVVTDAAGPVASVSSINRNGASMDFTIRYLDASGVNFSTLGNGDVTVGGPGGFVLPAAFVSMDNPTVAGGYKLVTYHVTLPATNPATSQLTFNLAAGAVKDIYNNSAAAGAIPKIAAQTDNYSYAWAKDLGTLTPNSARTEFSTIEPSAADHFYKFTLSAPMTVGAAISDMTGNGNILFAQDTDNDGWYEASEDIVWSDNTGSLDDATAKTFAAGTYYVRVYRLVNSTVTPFTLTVRAYNDSTPPTATLDAKDLRTAGAGTIDLAVTYSDDNEVDGGSAYWDAGLLIDGTATGGTTFFYWPSQVLNPSRANASSRTVYYRLIPYNNAPAFDSSYNATYIVSILPNSLRVHDGAGNNISPVVIGSFKIDINGADAAAPSATLSMTPPVAGQTTWDFNVVYKDNTAVDAASLDGNDIRVIGPAGFNQLAMLVSVSAAPAIGSARVATYRVAAPGGFWDGTDDGTYTVALQASQVRDSLNNSMGGATLGTVFTSMPNLVSTSSGVVTFNGTAGIDVMRFDADATFIYYSLSDASGWYISRSFVTRAIAAGLASSDAIDFATGSITGAVSGGAGANTLTVSGNLTLDTDAGNGSSPLAVTVSAGGSLTLTATQHLTSLTVASGTASMATNGSRFIFANTLSITGTGRLDLADNDFILDYTGDSPLGTLSGSTYNGVTGQVQSAANGGAWNGPGVGTAMSDALSLRTTIGVAEAKDVLGIPNGQTKLWQGQTVDSTTILIKYTYAGDANLDGVINADDYAWIDLYSQTLGSSGFNRGDFNYDGQINADDYALIDLMFLSPGGPL